MAPVPVPLGPRSRVRVLSAWRPALVVAATLARDSQDALDFRQLGDSTFLRGRGHRLRASAKQSQRKVRHVATGPPRPLRCETRRINERDPRGHLESPSRSRAALDRDFVHRCDRDVHHVRSGAQTQGQEMGTRDRNLCERSEDSRTPEVPVPLGLALRRSSRERVERLQRDAQSQERLDPRATRSVPPYRRSSRSRMQLTLVSRFQ